ncbi:MAG: DinB family protein [Acidobacteria bacterium]|nr:DinB family protein [Acidobacteriota bacterium]
MRISEGLLAEYDQETANTRKVLERSPEDKFGWQPHPKSWPMANLLTHLVNMLQWGAMTLTTDSFDYAPPGATPYKEEPVTSQAELLERFDKNVKETRAAIEATSDEVFVQPWSLLAGGAVVFTMPKVAVFRSMIMNHMIHHRAQLTLYLRLNDIPVPGLYGPSADEYEGLLQHR